jgi:hypothetical protein
VSLQFFSDQCVPAEISNELSRHGNSVVLLRDYLPIRSPDTLVIAKALEMGRILVSINGDFASAVQFPPERYGGIISIQLHNHPETIPHVMRQLVAFLELHPNPDYYQGKLIIAEAHRIRIRGLI